MIENVEKKLEMEDMVNHPATYPLCWKQDSVIRLLVEEKRKTQE